MNLTSATFSENFSTLVRESVIDLSPATLIDPWGAVAITLLLAERSGNPERHLILPKDHETLRYLENAGLSQLLGNLGYNANQVEGANFSSKLNEKQNIWKMVHCKSRDEFDARLGQFEQIFRGFGMESDDSKRVATLVGELGNNVFDHNSFNWPTDITGCIATGQNYPNEKKVQIVVGDPGVGFLGSLKNAYPDLEMDVEAIKKGLAGYTGRIGEVRGNGLRLIQEWTLKNFSGELQIHSGAGLVVVNKNGLQESSVPRTLGTLAQLMLYYG